MKKMILFSLFFVLGALIVPVVQQQAEYVPITLNIKTVAEYVPITLISPTHVG